MNLMRRMYHVNNVTFIMISIWLVEFQPSTEVNDQMNWHRKGSLLLSLAEGRLSNLTDIGTFFAQKIGSCSGGLLCEYLWAQ